MNRSKDISPRSRVIKVVKTYMDAGAPWSEILSGCMQKYCVSCADIQSASAVVASSERKEFQLID